MSIEKLVDRVRYEFKTRPIKPCRNELVEKDGDGVITHCCAVGSIIGDNMSMSYTAWAEMLKAEGIMISDYVLSCFILGWDGGSIDSPYHKMGHELWEELNVA